MGSGTSKDATEVAAASSSSEGREARFKGTRVFQSSCLGGSAYSSDNEDQASDPQNKENGRLKNETCKARMRSKSDLALRGYCGKVPQSNQALSISSDAELDEYNQERDENVGSAPGSGSSQKFVSRSSSRLSRSLSRFNFIPDNLSFRLSRAASLGSSCSYSFFSTSLSSSNSDERCSNGSENRDEIRANGGHHVELPSTNLSPASHSHDSSSVRQQLHPPVSVHSHTENFYSSQDLVQSHNGRRPGSSVNEYFQQNHIDTENAETRRFDRRAGAHEPAEGSVRFSRTLSVGRLRDRVLRRTSFPEGFFRHLQGDRVGGDAVPGNSRQVLGAGTRVPDGNMETSPSSSGHNIPSTSNSMNGQQDFDLEGPQMREASNHAFLERRTAFLERRRRIRSQVRALQRLGSRFENLSGHDRACILSGQHRTGHCACRASSRPINPDEDTSARASISRIVMLAEALFEVLDEIHQQSVVLSSRPSVSSIGSVPAPKEVVESMPVKIYKKPHKHQNEEVAQCYICLVEYDEGDFLRVLPCHHDFHQTCIDKWLKEIHRVCPLCRGDVCRSELLASTKVD